MSIEKAFQECDKYLQERQVLICSYIYIGFGLCGLIAQASQVSLLLILRIIFERFF
jgi:hypothetical protein